MLHGVRVLAISPQRFLRRFRSEKPVLIYDPSLGTDNGRVISEAEAIKAVSGYDLLFGQMERLITRSAKVFIPSLFLPFLVMPITKPSIGLYLFEIIIATMVGIIFFANARLWQFRRAVWQSVERGVSTERLSPGARIQHGYRMSWRSRIYASLLVLMFGPLYIYAHVGGDPKVFSLFGMGPTVKTYHTLFLVAVFVIFLFFIVATVARKYLRPRRSQDDNLAEQ